MVCGEIASNKNSHASQPTANNSEPNSNLSNRTLKDILQKEAAVNFLEGNEFKAILTDLRWLPRVFTNNPSYQAYVTEGNLVTLSLRFCSRDSPLRLPT